MTNIKISASMLILLSFCSLPALSMLGDDNDGENSRSLLPTLTQHNSRTFDSSDLDGSDENSFAQPQQASNSSIPGVTSTTDLVSIAYRSYLFNLGTEHKGAFDRGDKLDDTPDGWRKDYALSVYYYARAARLGHEQARENLDEMWQETNCHGRHISRAIPVIESSSPTDEISERHLIYLIELSPYAPQLGNSHARIELERMLREQNPWEGHISRTVSLPTTEDDPTDLFDLGMEHWRDFDRGSKLNDGPDGWKRSYALSAYYYARAARLGHEQARVELDQMWQKTNPHGRYISRAIPLPSIKSSSPTEEISEDHLNALIELNPYALQLENTQARIELRRSLRDENPQEGSVFRAASLPASESLSPAEEINEDYLSAPIEQIHYSTPFSSSYTFPTHDTEEFCPSSSLPATSLEDLESFLPRHFRTNHFKYLEDISKERNIRILSLDGGGMRGLLELEWLKKLEQDTGKKVYDLFDVFVGNSTGAIIAAALSAEFEIDEIIQLYEGSLAQDVFKGQFDIGGLGNMLWRAKYSPKSLEYALYSLFGKKRLADLKKPLLVPAIKSVEGGYKVYWFDSLKAQQSHLKNFKIRHLLRSTSAAQTFFPRARVKGTDGQIIIFSDGGLSENNPSFTGYLRLKKQLPKAEFSVFSLGTGQYLNPQQHNHGEGALSWAKRIPEICMSNQSKRAVKYCRQVLRENFFRIDTERLTAESSKMDNTASENLQELRRIAVEEATENRDFIRMREYLDREPVTNVINHYQQILLGHGPLTIEQEPGQLLFWLTLNGEKTSESLSKTLPRYIDDRLGFSDLVGLELSLGNLGTTEYDGLSRALERLPLLTILKLSGNQSPKELFISSLIPLQGLTELEQLELNRNKLTSLEIELLFNFLRPLTSLKLLSLEDNDIIRAEIPALNTSFRDLMASNALIRWD